MAGWRSRVGVADLSLGSLAEASPRDSMLGVAGGSSAKVDDGATLLVTHVVDKRSERHRRSGVSIRLRTFRCRTCVEFLTVALSARCPGVSLPHRDDSQAHAGASLAARQPRRVDRALALALAIPRITVLLALPDSLTTAAG